MATFSVEYFFTSLVTSLHNKLYGIFETLSLVHVYSCLCMYVCVDGRKCNYNTEFVFLGKNISIRLKGWVSVYAIFTS